MRAETGVDDELLAALGFGEFEEEDAGGEVVDVGEAEGDEGGGELVGDDLDGRVLGCGMGWTWGIGGCLPSRPGTRSAASLLR